MDCQASQSNVTCTNGYYGFQPVLNGSSGGHSEAGVVPQSNGHGGNHIEFNGTASSAAWQRKRTRDIFGNGDAMAGELESNGTAAKRLCPDLYHSKLQQAMGLSNGVCVATRDVFVENGMDCISIGSDSAMMATDEMELAGCAMATVNGFDSAHTPTHTDRSSATGVTTVGSSRAGLQHTCCSSRTQLCTMSFQQSYILSATQDCPRCMAGEPAPYLSISQTVENLSKLY